MYRVRFHLAKGENFRKWQVRHPDGHVTYHDPDTSTLVMAGCYLRNSRKVAERIHGGANKDVCAWVLCRNVSFAFTPWVPAYSNWPGEVRFNPRIMPHWHDQHGTDLDGTRFYCVMSYGRSLFGAQQNLLPGKYIGH
jgi:hypothetical protein